jgi:hypothetical protein
LTYLLVSAYTGTTRNAFDKGSSVQRKDALEKQFRLGRVVQYMLQFFSAALFRETRWCMLWGQNGHAVLGKVQCVQFVNGSLSLKNWQSN